MTFWRAPNNARAMREIEPHLGDCVPPELSPPRQVTPPRRKPSTASVVLGLIMSAAAVIVIAVIVGLGWVYLLLVHPPSRFG